MAKSSREGREELVMRVQAALNLATKKEASDLANVIVSCLEDTLVEHLAEDGYYLKLNGLGKFIVRHRPAIRRKIGFSGEIRDLPVKRKVKFTGLGKLRQLE
ncbi:MAG TPA: HU family DNA-binding protein [Terracidiphilus sp.]|jgi:nucleoid DNA-binding protein